MTSDDSGSPGSPGAPHSVYAPLEELIGYTFRDGALCETAMTHTSWVNEASNTSRTDNERLEFLGDAVLALVVSDLLMRRFPDRSEGELTRARAALVSEGGLARAAYAIELGKWIFLGKGEERAGGRNRQSIVANALEALMGAIYVDGGIAPAAAVAARLFAGMLEDVERHAQLDHKSRLQERAQALWQTTPTYEVVAQEGPDHDRRFEVALTLRGKEYGRAIGRSKKEAEQSAAAQALAALDAPAPRKRDDG